MTEEGITACFTFLQFACHFLFQNILSMRDLPSQKIVKKEERSVIFSDCHVYHLIIQGFLLFVIPGKAC